jgi:hypothetical protein
MTEIKVGGEKGDGEVMPEAADDQTIKILETVLGIVRAPKTNMNDEVF